jgi:hypothetical protein
VSDAPRDQESAPEPQQPVQQQPEDTGASVPESPGRAVEKRLNELIPPGATSDPKARAAAITNENAALRIYLGQDAGSRTADWWRQVPDV